MSSKYNSGVYCIEIGDKYYIGLSSNLTARKSRHLSGLRHGCHKNPYMQAAYNKHGEYSFKTLVYCEGDYMSRLEASLIQQHYADERCMNLISDDGCGSYKHSEETRRKIGESNSGKPLSEETKRKLSESRRGKIASNETRMRMSMSHRGRCHTPETLQKIRESLRGRGVSAETRQKISNALQGRRLSDEHCENLSNCRRGKRKPSCWRAVVMRGPGGQEFYFAAVAFAAAYFGVFASNLRTMLSGGKWPRPNGKSKLAGWTGHYIDKEADSGN